jgi:uncharacterized protein YndB with AHSA1/START domain
MTRLSLEQLSPTQVRIIRDFAAPPALVWRAHMEPALIRQWCYGPDDWEMTRCEVDPRPGGRMVYAWANRTGPMRFHMEGEFLEIEPQRRILHVERMFLPDPTPENRVETRFEARNGGTRLTMLMSMPTAEAMAAMLATGMADGMEMSYARIDRLAF